MVDVTRYTVGELASLAQISVRTLHYYNAIGLVTPSGRSPSGYRLYSEEDLIRLRQVLFYRELDFRLEQIAEILADPNACADDHLRRQHRLLRQRQARTEALLGAIEKEMEARHMGISLTREEQFEIFGTDQLGGAHAEEAHQRWGDTDAWAQSRRRTAAYAREDWGAIKAGADANRQGFADAMAAGEPADGEVAGELAESHRRHISRWYYRCGPDMHRNLAELYVSDPRFAAHYDELMPGLARYVHDAVCASAERTRDQ